MNVYHTQGIGVRQTDEKRNVQHRGLRSTDKGVPINCTPSVARGLKHGLLREGILNQVGVYQAGDRRKGLPCIRNKKEEAGNEAEGLHWTQTAKDLGILITTAKCLWCDRHCLKYLTCLN